MSAKSNVTKAGAVILHCHRYDRLSKGEFTKTWRWDGTGYSENAKAVEKLLDAGMLLLNPVGMGGVTSLTEAGRAFSNNT